MTLRLARLVAVAVITAAPAASAAQPAPAGSATDEAQDRSREAELFGEEDPQDAATDEAGEPRRPAPSPPTPDEARAADLGDARLEEVATEKTELFRDRSQLGGLFYSRHQATLPADTSPADLRAASSVLFDLYFDTRVNDRVRAFARGRLLYDPLADVATTGGVPAFGLPAGAKDETRALLDQLWLKFDVARTVFLTIGKQHVRWGATRLWNPADVINPTRREPLTFFDERTGLPAVKVHVPFEGLGWNAYALFLTDDAVRYGHVGAAGRLEMVLGPAEVGVSGLVKKGTDPKIGLDLSAGVGEIDVTAEFGYVSSDAKDTWQASAGASWTWAYADDDTLVLGVEYFHNPQGAASAAEAIDETLAAVTSGKPLPFAPFYTGRHYLSALVVLMAPGDFKDSSVTLIGISNLSDQSGIARLSVASRVLTDLGIEAWASGQWGEGEFGAYVPVLRRKLGSEVTAGLLAPFGQAGINLRVDL